MPDSQDHDGYTEQDSDAATGAHEPPAVVEVSLDAPQFQVAAANPERVERGIAVMFVLGLVGFAGFGAAYWQNDSNFWLGVTMAIGFLGLGIGMIGWGKYLMPRGPFSESRHPNEPTPAEREVFLEDLSSRGKVALGRRSYLLKILGAAGGVFGIVALFPLLRSLGPLPGSLFYNTGWKKGSHLVTPEGRYVHKDDLEKGGVLTVFPETDVGGALSQTILIRPESASYGFVVTAPGRENWGPEGYLAFSKVCTHAGCPVALYQKALDELLCPCHQSIFEVGPDRPATPVFGPAPRPLPQLALYIDSKGYLRAQHRYNEPVGPGFWERGSS